MADAAPYYEYIVIGCGGIGSGTLYWLSTKAPGQVLGLEQFKLGHENGGSQDHSRIIRLMYNSEQYTRIARASYDAWSAVEEESGVQLVHKTGSLDMARRGSKKEKVLEDYAKAMTCCKIPYEELSQAEMKKRFPQWTIDSEIRTLYQPDGGLVDAAMGNAIHIQLARARGARVVEECRVERLEHTTLGAKVYTNRGTFRCKKVVVTGGAWINQVLGSVGVHIPVIVSQEQVSYFATPHVKEFTKEKFPVYIFHDEKYDLYGLPIHGNSGSKIGIDAGGPSVLPSTRNFVVDPARMDVVKEFCQKYLPRSLGPELLTKTCLYTMTLDRNFVVDTLAGKGMPNIIVCCGAGHAYKWASLLGKILSQMAVDGKSEYPIDTFTMNRPAITDPNFQCPDHGLGVHCGYGCGGNMKGVNAKL